MKLFQYNTVKPEGMKGYPGHLIKMNGVLEVASDWEGNRKERCSDSEGRKLLRRQRSVLLTQCPPCHRLTVMEELE